MLPGNSNIYNTVSINFTFYFLRWLYPPRKAEVHVNMLICDLHCDTVHKLSEYGLRDNPTSHVDLRRMLSAGYALGTFAAFVDAKHTSFPSPWDECLSLIGQLHDEFRANSDLITPVLWSGDIDTALSGGKMMALLSVEEGGVVEHDISRLDNLFSLGVRMTTLTWNYENTLACPAYCSGAEGAMPTVLGNTYIGGGLTELGRSFVEKCNELGIIIDVSHLSDAGFYDIARFSRRPFIASHSNAREVTPYLRNLTDDMIKIISSRGGLIGLNLAVDFLGGGDGESLVRHAIHIAKIGGVDCLALGGDLDGIPTNPYFPDCAAVPKIADYLLAAGFTSGEVDKIMGENVLRFLRENLPKQPCIY